MNKFANNFEAVAFLKKNKLKKYYCYALVHKGQPFYIGVAKDVKRLYQHERDGVDGNRSCNILKERKIASIKAKKETVEYWIINTFYSELEVHHAEKSLIIFYGKKIDHTGILTNLSDGGLGRLGLTTSEKQKETVRKNMTGRTVSDETRAKSSKSQKELAAIRGSTFKGKKHSEETKKLMSQRTLGHTHSAKGKDHYGYGKKRSPETIAKIKEGQSKVDMSCSEERKEEQRLYWKNQPVMTCPHCGKQSSFKAAMVKWHFDKCKSLIAINTKENK